MGLHLYVRDEIDRGTNWNCTADELVRYAAGSEPQQVLAPFFLKFLPIHISFRLQKFARLASNISRVSVYDESDLEDWVHDDGPLVLIGDSAHPMPVGRSFVCSYPVHVH